MRTCLGIFATAALLSIGCMKDAPPVPAAEEAAALNAKYQQEHEQTHPVAVPPTKAPSTGTALPGDVDQPVFGPQDGDRPVLENGEAQFARAAALSRIGQHAKDNTVYNPSWATAEFAAGSIVFARKTAAGTSFIVEVEDKKASSSMGTYWVGLARLADGSVEYPPEGAVYAPQHNLEARFNVLKFLNRVGGRPGLWTRAKDK
jgi:hypothetical protein